MKTKLECVIKSPCKELVLPENVFLPEFVWEEGIKHHPEKLALVNGVTGRSYTYKEGYESCKKISIALKGLGIKKGDVVALFMPNNPECIVFFLGAAGIGAITTPINPNSTQYEVSRQFEASNTKLVITVPSFTDTIEKAITKINSAVKIIVVDEGNEKHGTIYPTYPNLIEQIPKNEAEKFLFQGDAWNETAYLPYSSGTTGLPKGVMLTTRNLVSSIYLTVYGEELEFIKFATDKFQSKTICVLPMYHVMGAMMTSMPTLRAGGQVITIPRFEPGLFSTALKNFKPTFLHLTPPLLAFLANDERVTPEHLDLVDNITVILRCMISKLGRLN